MTRQTRSWVAAVAGHGCQAPLQRNTSWCTKCGLQRIEAVIQNLKRQTHEGTPALNLRWRLQTGPEGPAGASEQPEQRGRHPVSRQGAHEVKHLKWWKKPEGKCRNPDIGLVTQLSGDSTLVVKTQHMALGRWAQHQSPEGRARQVALLGLSGSLIHCRQPDRACQNPSKRGMET